MCIAGQPSSAAMVRNKDGAGLKWNRADDLAEELSYQANGPLTVFILVIKYLAEAA